MSLSLLRMPLPRALAWLAVMAGAAIVILDPLPGTEGRVLGLAVAFIGLWATAVIPEPITAVYFFTMAMLLKAAPPATVFGGFESGALWLIFGGLVMGIAVRSTGLGERIAARLGRSFGTSYWGLISGITLVGVAMGFLMPSSMGRAILLMPIAVGLAGRYGFEPGSNGRIGVVLAAAFGCHVPTFSILPANLPNLVLVGASERLWQWTPSYGEYFLLHFPVMGLLKTLVMIPIIVMLWPDTPRIRQAEAKALPPMSAKEGRLAVLLAGALLLWVTDFIHHVSPAWISLSAGALLLLPGIGLVSRKEFAEQINYGSMLYVAGIMGLGAIVDQSGLGARLAHLVLDLLPLAPGQAAGNFASLATLSTVTAVVTTLPGAPAVLTPMAGQMAEASGFSVQAVLMSQVLGFSNPILPYQSAPMVVAMQLGGERLGPAQRLCLWLAGITILVLLPLDFLWWRLLGWI
jgi:di/tricarboxylate transporter